MESIILLIMDLYQDLPKHMKVLLILKQVKRLLKESIFQI